MTNLISSKMSERLLNNSLLASTATNVMITLLWVALALGLIYLLYRGVRRENIKFLALSEKSLTVDLNELRALVSRAMQKQKCEFVLMEISINDVENIERVCGEAHYGQALEDMLSNIKLALPHGIKVAKIDKEHIWIYIKGKIKREALEIICRNMMKEVSKPIVLIGSLNVEFEVNIAALIYEQGLKDINTIAANLELTTIVSKKRGPGNAVIFDRTISNITSEEYTLYTEIKQAIKNNDFRIFYQPIINTESLECYSVEAFLRWQHEVKGIISPDVFMPSLEHSGDIDWVGMWAFESIAKQLEYWKIHNSEIRTKVNVNWTLGQLSNARLGEKIRNVLKKYKVLASDFCFEIPSYKQAMSMETAARNINFFRQMGIGIAIDNINLELSTITDIDGTDVNMLKFNREFVNKLTSGKSNDFVAQTIAQNSAQKHIMVVAEGVENQEMCEKLKEIGIPLAQGYYFSRPKAPTEAMADIMLTPWKV